MKARTIQTSRGGSFYVSIPIGIARNKGLSKGSLVEFEEREDVIIFRRIK